MELSELVDKGIELIRDVSLKRIPFERLKNPNYILLKARILIF